MPKSLFKKFLIIFLTAIIIAFGISFLSATQATTKFFYTVTELSSPTTSNSVAYDINDSGQVVGSVYVAYGRNARMNSVLWENGAIIADWHVNPLLNYAAAINNAGQVACSSDPGSHVSGRCPYLWEKGDLITYIGECGGTSYVNGINNAGQVVGWDIQQPFVWKDGVTTFLSVLSGNSNGSGSRALGINNKGQIVGYSKSHAVLWQPNGSIKDLGFLPGGSYSEAWSLNQSGQVVGWAEHRSRIKHAVLWENGVIKNLGTLNGKATQATDINRRGTVVGYSSVTNQYSNIVPEHAFLWRNGIMWNLNKLIPASSGWELNTARAINNRGQIVGEGKFNGQQRAYLLTPTWTIN